MMRSGTRFILGLLMTVIALGALLALILIGGDHVRAQLVAAPSAASGTLRPVTSSPFQDLNPDRLQNSLLGFYLRLRQSDLDAPASQVDHPVTFTVNQGEPTLSIAQRLEQQGLIRDANLFRLYLRFYAVDQKVEAGDFALSPAMSMRAVAARLQRARFEEVTVTIPEGWRMEQVADLLNQNAVIDGQQFLALVRSPDMDKLGNGYDFLTSGRPVTASLEGYLFPDTYRLPARAQPEELVKRMLDNFGSKVNLDLRNQAEAHKLTLYQVLSVASIVEREAVVPNERPLIASVYLNRLSADRCSEVAGFLNADPTVQYAMGYQPATRQWWKTPVFLEDYQNVHSPYNTYLSKGLPPGPIASPGLDSIKAVIAPASTNYCYFVGTGTGTHAFAATAAEHAQNVAKYEQRK